MSSSNDAEVGRKYPDGTKWTCQSGSVFELRDGDVYLVSSLSPIKQFSGTLELLESDTRTFTRIDPPPSQAVAAPTPPAPDSVPTAEEVAKEFAEEVWRHLIGINSGEKARVARLELVKAATALITADRDRLAAVENTSAQWQGIASAKDDRIAAAELKLAAAGGGVDKELLETSRQIMAATIDRAIAETPMRTSLEVKESADKAANNVVVFARALHAALRQAGGVE